MYCTCQNLFRMIEVFISSTISLNDVEMAFCTKDIFFRNAHTQRFIICRWFRVEAIKDPWYQYDIGV